VLINKLTNKQTRFWKHPTCSATLRWWENMSGLVLLNILC